MAIADGEWMTIAEAAAYLKVTRATLYRWARQGNIQLFKFGPRLTRVRSEDVRAVAHPIEDRDWAVLAQDSFARDWDNEKDAVYDKWRELYAVRDR
jgi:excisionase family DNA binding protein